MMVCIYFLWSKFFNNSTSPTTLTTMPLSSKSEIEWAFKQAMASIDSPYLFPRYVRKGFCNNNSASTALNKPLKPRVSEGCLIHSFRHSMLDRLRAEECPPENINVIGGWISADVGKS